jgi:hypothetical protein
MATGHKARLVGEVHLHIKYDVTWNVLATDWCCFAFIKEMESHFDVLKFFLKWPHTIRYFHFACLVLGLQQLI